MNNIIHALQELMVCAGTLILLFAFVLMIYNCCKWLANKNKESIAANQHNWSLKTDSEKIESYYQGIIILLAAILFCLIVNLR